MRNCKYYGRKDHKNTMYSMQWQHNVPIFIKKWPRLAILQSKIQFFVLRQAIPRSIPVILRVLHAKLQVVIT